MHRLVTNFFQKAPNFASGINKYFAPLYKDLGVYRSLSPFVDNIRHLSNSLADGQIPVTGLGTSNFRKLVLSSTILVDKTMLIRDIEHDQSEVSLFTFPRRWGKTTNLTMLKEFYQLDDNEDNGDSYKLFAGGAVRLSNKKIKELPALQIAKDKDVMKEQGAWPVIYIDLKDISGSSYRETLDTLKEQVYQAWIQHSYLLDSNKLSGSQLNIVEHFIDNFKIDNLNEVQIKKSLKKLSEILHQHHGKKVKILIDEYDSAVNKAYIDENIDSKDIQKIINLYRDFLSPALKSNDYLDKAILTGIFKLAKANIFSGLNNVISHSMGDIEFAQYYGFTQEEVEKLLEVYNVDSEMATLIKDWYNGYNSGELQIYNPWSVVNVLNKYQTYSKKIGLKYNKNDVLGNYWGESGNMAFVMPLLKHKDIKSQIETLASGGGIYFNAINELSVEDYVEFRNMISLGQNYYITLKGMNVLFSYLLAGGYFTHDRQSDLYFLPNQEVKDYIQSKLAEYYERQYNIDLNNIHAVTDQIQLIFDAKTSKDYNITEANLTNKLIKLFQNLPNFNRVSKDIVDIKSGEYNIHANEAMLQTIVNYTALQLKKINQFGTEVYLGNGRVDLFMVHQQSNKVIIIEFKYDKQEANSAIEQIKEKQYAKPMPKGYEVIQIGINVDYDKNVNVKIDSQYVYHDNDKANSQITMAEIDSDNILDLTILDNNTQFVDKITIIGDDSDHA